MKTLLFLYLFIISVYSFATDKFLDTCISIAVKRNKKLLAKEEEIKLAEKQLWATTRNFFPSIFLQHRYSRGKAGKEDSPEEYQAEDRWIRLYQPIYDGGRLSAAHKYYSHALELAKIDYIRLKEELKYKIKVAYYEYISSVLEMKETEKLLSEINDYYNKLTSEYLAKAISELELQEGKVFKQKIENFYQKAKKNMILYQNKLLMLVGIKSLDEIIYDIPFDVLTSLPKEIDYDLEQLKNLLTINNPDLKKLRLNMKMAEEKKKIVVAKVRPKFYFEGSYGQSGEAYVAEPLKLATVWVGMLRLSWLFGGSSLESSYQKEKTIPREILDVSQRIDATILDTKLGLFDDIKYFVDKKEADTTMIYTEAEYQETEKLLMLELEKFYHQYYYSLIDAKVAYDDLELKKWHLEVSKKKNLLYEVSTLEVMGNIYKVSEALLTYSKALLQNYIAVAELEKLVLIPLR